MHNDAFRIETNPALEHAAGTSLRARGLAGRADWERRQANGASRFRTTYAAQQPAGSHLVPSEDSGGVV